MKKTTNITKTSKKSKLTAYLETGKSVTEQLAKSRFKLGNLRATISDIRNENGYVIEPTKTKNGTKYAIVG